MYNFYKIRMLIYLTKDDFSVSSLIDQKSKRVRKSMGRNIWFMHTLNKCGFYFMWRCSLLVWVDLDSLLNSLVVVIAFYMNTKAKDGGKNFLEKMNSGNISKEIRWSMEESEVKLENSRLYTFQCPCKRGNNSNDNLKLCTFNLSQLLTKYMWNFRIRIPNIPLICES